MKILIGVLIFLVLNMLYLIFRDNASIVINAQFFTSPFLIGMIIQALIAAISFYLAEKLVSKGKS